MVISWLACGYGDYVGSDGVDRHNGAFYGYVDGDGDGDGLWWYNDGGIDECVVE